MTLQNRISHHGKDQRPPIRVRHHVWGGAPVSVARSRAVPSFGGLCFAVAEIDYDVGRLPAVDYGHRL